MMRVHQIILALVAAELAGGRAVSGSYLPLFTQTVATMQALFSQQTISHTLYTSRDMRER